MTTKQGFGKMAVAVALWFTDNPIGRSFRIALEKKIKEAAATGTTLTSEKIIKLLEENGFNLESIRENKLFKWLGQTAIEVGSGLLHIKIPAALVGGNELEAQKVEGFVNDLIEEAGKGIAESVSGKIKVTKIPKNVGLAVARIKEIEEGLYHRLDRASGTLLCQQAERLILGLGLQDDNVLDPMDMNHAVQKGLKSCPHCFDIPIVEDRTEISIRDLLTAEQYEALSVVITHLVINKRNAELELLQATLAYSGSRGFYQALGKFLSQVQTRQRPLIKHGIEQNILDVTNPEIVQSILSLCHSTGLKLNLSAGLAEALERLVEYDPVGKSEGWLKEQLPGAATVVGRGFRWLFGLALVFLAIFVFWLISWVINFNWGFGISYALILTGCALLAPLAQTIADALDRAVEIGTGPLRDLSVLVREKILRLPPTKQELPLTLAERLAEAQKIRLAIYQVAKTVSFFSAIVGVVMFEEYLLGHPRAADSGRIALLIVFAAMFVSRLAPEAWRKASPTDKATRSLFKQDMATVTLSSCLSKILIMIAWLAVPSMSLVGYLGIEHGISGGYTLQAKNDPDGKVILLYPDAKMQPALESPVFADGFTSGMVFVEQDLWGRTVVKAIGKDAIHNIGNDGYSFVRRWDGTIKAGLALEESATAKPVTYQGVSEETYEEEDEDYTFDQERYDEAKKKVEDGLQRLREIGK